MSGARLARSGRARFFLCFLALVLMLGMVAIFHNTTRQLDQTREQQLQCEQQQQNINEELSSVINQKSALQKSFELERNKLVAELKKTSEKLANDKLSAHVSYEKLQQSYKILESELKELKEDCSKTKVQQLEEVNALNLKLQEITSKADKEKNVLNSKLAMLREKYKDHVDAEENRSRLLQLEHIVSEYQANCNYQPKAVSALAHLQINKPIDIPQIAAGNSSPQTTEQKNSFNQQVRVGDGRYNINIKTNKTIKELTASNIGDGTTTTTSRTTTTTTTTTTTIPLAFAERQNRSLILNSVENFQILPKMLNKMKQDTQANEKQVSPLSAPHKLTSAEINHKQAATNSSHNVAHSSTSGLPALPMPPQEQQQQSAQLRKLPENVAPIPENFDALFKNDEQQQKEDKEQDQEQDGGSNKQVVETQGAANVPDKAEQVAKTDDGNNNRYANVVNDLGSNAKPDMNAKDFNVPINNEDENNHFLDGAESQNIAQAGNNDNIDNEAGDIAVKNKNKVLDTDNVNNEVMGDQGKELDDGLRLEEGMEEDADEDDDYSNLARQNGEQAIRN